MTDKPYNVRPARVGDEDNIYNLLMLLYAENAPFHMSEKKVRHVIAEGVRDREVIIGVIDALDGTIAGSIGGLFAQWWHTEDWHIDEMWNFVHPDYRSIPENRFRPNGEKDRVSYAVALIDYMKWISEHMNMSLHMGIITATKMEAKIRLYRRQMQHVGALFVHNIQAAGGPLAENSRKNNSSSLSPPLTQEECKIILSSNEVKTSFDRRTKRELTEFAHG